MQPLDTKKLILLLIGSLFVVALALYAGGQMFFDLSGKDAVSVYPWTLLVEWMTHTTAEQQHLLLLSTIVPGVVLIFGVFVALRQLNLAIHGDARWAHFMEVKSMGFRQRNGVVLGVMLWQYLVYDDVRHILVFAPTRSGKTKSIIIPTLLSTARNIIALDIKYELFRYTSGYRAENGDRVYAFFPFSAARAGHCWNPLHYISADRINRIDDIQGITGILVYNPEAKDKIWISGAKQLLSALILFLIDSPNHQATLGYLNRVIKSTQDLAGWIEAQIRDCDFLDELAVMNFNAFLQKAYKERSGVVSEITTALELWDNPLVDAATSHNDFDFRDLRRKPMSIYFGLPPDKIDKAGVSMLVRLFFHQVIALLSRQEPTPKEPYQVEMILDEFKKIGRMDILKDGMSYLAGYGVRMMPIVQSPVQLDDTYGPNGKELFFSQAGIRVAFAQNTPQSGQFVADMLGAKTVTSRTDSWSGGQLKSTAYSPAKMPLLSSDKVQKLAFKKLIILSEGKNPILASKAYFEDKIFQSRIRPAVKLPRYQMITYPKLAVASLGEEAAPAAMDETQMNALLDDLWRKRIDD